MKQRINIKELQPEAYAAMQALERYGRTTDIQPIHKELIKIRASQINKCAFCLNMHSKDARALGETEQRIYALSAWEESPYFSDEEKALLALTEAVTLIAQSGLPDEIYNRALQFFSEQQVAQIIMLIVTINAWNRIAVSIRWMPQ